MTYQYRLLVIQTDGQTDLQEQYNNTVYEEQSVAQSTADDILSQNPNLWFQIVEEEITITS